MRIDTPIDWRLPAPEIAAQVLGCHVRRESAEGTVVARLSEVEAYDGAGDPASHAYRGKTARNAVMFGEPGYLYVYFSYGIHWCANIVCGPPGEASAVLLRGAEIVDGVELARTRRGDHVPDQRLARGPACLTQALGIGRADDGAYLLGAGPIQVAGGDDRDLAVCTGPRVGVSKAADVPWRFWVDGDRTVSAYKRSPRAPSSPA